MTRKKRQPSPIAERRRARKAARAVCVAEAKRVAKWAPEERKRVAGMIVQMRAHGAQQLAQLRAQTSELIKIERAELGKRIKAARAAARLGQCVDLTAGPALRMFGPRRPPKDFRPPPPGSRAANPDAYDRRSRELVSEAHEAQRRATAHAKEVARGFAYNPRHPDRPLRRPGSKKAGIRALKPKGKLRAKGKGRSSRPPASAAANGVAAAFLAHEQLTAAEFGQLFALSDRELGARLNLTTPAAIAAARGFWDRNWKPYNLPGFKAKASKAPPPRKRGYSTVPPRHSSAPPAGASARRSSAPPSVDRFAAGDYRAMLALSDARKAENKARRAALRANAELRAHLLTEAVRRGEREINWLDYFQQIGIADGITQKELDSEAPAGASARRSSAPPPALAGGHAQASTLTEGRNNALIAHEQMSAGEWERLFAQSDTKLSRQLSLTSPIAVRGAREFYARDRAELSEGTAPQGFGAAGPAKPKAKRSSKPGKAPPDQYRVQYRGSVKLFKGRNAREKAQSDAEFQSSRYAGVATVSKRIAPGPNGWEVYDRWQGSKHSHKSSSDRANGRL